MTTPSNDPVEVAASAVMLIERLARIEEKLDTSLRGQLDHELRLRSIERWRYALPVTAVTALISGALAIFAMVYGQ